MQGNAIKDKSLRFALRIVRLNKYLRENKRELILSRQLLKSGTSIGAQIREGQYAESRPDFIHKMAIALKEANETEYWLILLHEAGYLDDVMYESMLLDVRELLKLLTSIINTTKKMKKADDLPCQPF